MRFYVFFFIFASSLVCGYLYCMQIIIFLFILMCYFWFLFVQYKYVYNRYMVYAMSRIFCILLYIYVDCIYLSWEN